MMIMKVRMRIRKWCRGRRMTRRRRVLVVVVRLARVVILDMVLNGVVLMIDHDRIDYEAGSAGTGTTKRRCHIAIRDRPYGHCLVAGISKCPKKVIREDSAEKTAKKSRVKASIKLVNYHHIMPTRYTLDVDLKDVVTADVLTSRDKKMSACKETKKRLEERFKTGKNHLVFSKLRRGHAKVKWKDVCLLKCQGGLGIKALNIWNISFIAKHIWNVVSKKDSLWVKWCRDVLRMHFVHRIGDGSQTSVWFDNWLSLGPLSLFISKRDIYEARLSLDCKVCDIVERGDWKWPEEWRNKFSVLFLLPPPIIFHDRKDRVLWKSNNGKIGDFSASNVWADLAKEKPMVSWHKRPINRSIWSILQRLVIGFIVYFIWLERNLRRFQNKRRPVKDLCGIIRDNVRLRLMSLKIKKFVQVMEAARLWDFVVEELFVLISMRGMFDWGVQYGRISGVDSLFWDTIGVMDLDVLDMDMEDNEEDYFKTSWIVYYFSSFVICIMTSADDIVHSLLNEYMDKVGKNKNRKPHRGIKVFTHGSAGAGFVLRPLRSAKVTRKARGRANDSLVDNRGAKHAANSPRNDEIGKVLHGLSPLENSILNEQCSPVAKSYGPKTSLDHTGMGDVGNTSCGLASSKDDIASLRQAIIDAGQTSSQDGIASNKGGSGFVFGKNVNFAGVLKKPLGPVFNVQYSNDMTSADDIVHSLLNEYMDKVGKNKNRKPHRGIKVFTHGSAGAGFVLRPLRSAKVTRKARGRANDSPVDNRGAKHAANSPRNDEIGKVLHGLRSGSFNSNLKFSMGHSVDVSNPVCWLNHDNSICNENDGSFIKSPLENSILNEQCSPVAKSYGPKTSLDHTGMGDVGNTSCGLASSKDGIASLRQAIIDAGQTSSQDGIASNKGGSGFVFGKNVNFAGVLKKPLGPVFNVQYSNDVKCNPFGRSNNGKDIGASNGGWNAGVGNKFGSIVLSNQFSAVEPGIWLDKTEPPVIPIWVCVYNILMELFNGNGIDKIMNGVGKPLLMDNMTKERCLKKSGKLDFARVLVEVSANDVLPSSLEISYPPIGILLCLVRKPRTEEEIAAKNLRDAFKIRKHVVDDSGNNNVDDEGFTIIGKKNRHAAPQINIRLSKGGGMSNKKNNIGNKAPVQEIKKKSLVVKPVLASAYYQDFRPKVSVLDDEIMKEQKECVLETMEEEYNSEIWPKLKHDVIDAMETDDDVATDDGVTTKEMRAEDMDLGSGSAVAGMSSLSEDVPVKNLIQVLDDEIMKEQEECVLETMEEEYNSEIWPKLKHDVIDAMET
nr:60S ribosomal protein L27-like [Tanacetum cinerariifolium]